MVSSGTQVPKPKVTKQNSKRHFREQQHQIRGQPMSNTSVHVERCNDFEQLDNSRSQKGGRCADRCNTGQIAQGSVCVDFVNRLIEVHGYNSGKKTWWFSFPKSYGEVVER